MTQPPRITKGQGGAASENRKGLGGGGAATQDAEVAERRQFFRLKKQVILSRRLGDAYEGDPLQAD